MMEMQGVLSTTEARNLALRAFSRLGAIGAMLATLKKNVHIAADLETYHILADGCLVEGRKRALTGTVYQMWRLLVKEVPVVKPDVALMNKLIQCCEISKEFERAFFFLTVFNDYNLSPNLETFRLLFKVRCSVFIYNI